MNELRELELAGVWGMGACIEALCRWFGWHYPDADP